MPAGMAEPAIWRPREERLRLRGVIRDIIIRLLFHLAGFLLEPGLVDEDHLLFCGKAGKAMNPLSADVTVTS